MHFRVAVGVIALSFVFGLIYRIFPLFSGPGAIAEFFITEDGYLMLAVSRNLAIGNGLSVADGLIATNGVQPFATFLYSIPFVFSAGAKLAALKGILAIMTAASVMAALAIGGYARQILRHETEEPAWPWLVAALWFVGPLLLFHSMNALETGLYTFFVVSTFWYFGHLTSRTDMPSTAEQLVLGLLCGLTFLARNDAVFVVAALFVVRFFHFQIVGRASLRVSLREALTAGVACLAVALPWLAYNRIFFGAFMPISGKSQSVSAVFGGNLEFIPARLFETMFPMLPIPGNLETTVPVIAVSVVAVAAVLARSLWLLFLGRNPFRLSILAYTIFGCLMVFYYGFFFGAAHFISRYLAPLSPLLILAAATVLIDLAQKLGRRGLVVANYLGLGALALSMLLLLRFVIPDRREHMHFQVVDWVEENLAEETWVGAIQTGTLGFWHDRTINLDGKTNPEALRARAEDGDVLNYVVDSDIEYLADWVGIVGWIDLGNQRFSSTFEVLVADQDNNLGVLRRIANGNPPATE